MIDVLSIGNSFSQDAQRYLHGVAKADGMNLQAFNLYIGGCSLERHYQNMLGDKKDYRLEMNGISTGFMTSLKEALLTRGWDIITIQQVSSQAPDYETYQPYLDSLIQFIRLHVPKAKIAVHQTWAYEAGCDSLLRIGYDCPEQMLENIVKAYDQAAKDICADFLIPSGQVLGALADRTDVPLHRDTTHASLGLGRYALALTWYRTLTGNDIRKNSFSDFDAEIAPELVALAKECVTQVTDLYKK